MTNSTSNNLIKPKETYLTSNELMQVLQMARSTMEVLVRRGMPCVKLGRNRRLKLSEVDEWLKTEQQ